LRKKQVDAAGDPHAERRGLPGVGEYLRQPGRGARDSRRPGAGHRQLRNRWSWTPGTRTRHATEDAQQPR
jgi:hypothetical protein